MSTAEEEDRLAAEAAGLSAAQQAALTAYHSEANFLLLHRPQFESMRLPKQLWPVVYRKIYTETDDAADAFVIAQEETEEEDDDSDTEAAAGFHLVVQREEGLRAAEDVWVLQHALSAKEQDAVQQLTREPALVDRLWALMDLDTRLRREEREAERRKLAEVEARQRREDRKETDDAEEERRMKEAEEEKQRDRDRRLQQAEAERAAAADYSDDESIAVLMTQTGASREQAVQALSNSSGDVIEAINALNLSEHADVAAQPRTVAASSASSSSSSSSSRPLSLSSLSDDERRAKTVWDALFRYDYVHVFYTAEPREERRELRAEDVQAVLYCNDEVGSAVAAGPSPNAELRPLYCVTLNTAVSLLWLTRDAEQGTELSRPVRPQLRKTREWSR